MSALDWTPNTIFERLYLFLGLGTFEPWVKWPYAPTTPPLIHRLFLDFCAIFWSAQFANCKLISRFPVPSFHPARAGLLPIFFFHIFFPLFFPLLSLMHFHPIKSETTSKTQCFSEFCDISSWCVSCFTYLHNVLNPNSQPQAGGCMNMKKSGFRSMDWEDTCLHGRIILTGASFSCCCGGAQQRSGRRCGVVGFDTDQTLAEIRYATAECSQRICSQSALRHTCRRLCSAESARV